MDDKSASLPPTHRFQKRPNIVLGLDAQECVYALVGCLIISVITCIVISLSTGGFLLGLGAALITFFASFFFFARYMQKIKHGRPNGFYQQQVMLFMQRHGFGGPFIVKSGYKNISR